MAKLPAYQPQTTTLDAGSDTYRGSTDNGAAIAQGLSKFGAGVSALGESEMKIATLQAGKAYQADQLMAGLEEHKTQSRFEQDNAREFQKHKDTADPSGNGFEASYIETYDQKAAQYIDGAPDEKTRLQREVIASRLKTGYVKAAGAYESQLIFNGLKDVQKSTYEDAAAIVGQIPNADGLALAESHLREKGRQLNLTPQRLEHWVQAGRLAIEQGALSGRIALDPGGVVRAGESVYRNLPTKTATDTQKALINGANATGNDPNVMLAIGWIESKHNPDVTTDLSSARGTLQFLKKSAYGNPNLPYGGIDPKDTEGQARALGDFLSRVKERYAGQGITITPGQQYMFHNVGEGVAGRLVAETDGSKKMGTVLFETYGNSRMPNGQLWRDVVGRNNPGLYSPNMTVDQVRQSYEAKISAAMKQAEGLVTGQGATSEQVLRQQMSEYLGFDVKALSTSDLNKAIGIAQKSIQAAEKKKNDDGLYYGYITGQLRMSPNDPEQQKLIDKGIREQHTELYEGFVKGDEKAGAQVREIVRNTSYIPKPFVEGARELIHSGLSTEAKVSAYNFMNDVREMNPTAYDAAKIDEDTNKRIKLYAANVASMGSKGAMEYVDRYNSPEGKQQREAVKKTLGDKKGEIAKLQASDFTPGLSEGFLIRGLLTDSQGVGATTAQERFLEDARDRYKIYREDGMTPDEAKRMATEDLKRAWGASQALVGMGSRARIMRNPPDKYYSQPTTGMKPFEDQALEVVGSELSRRYPLTKEDREAKTYVGGGKSVALEDDRTSLHGATNVQPRIVSTVETEQDIRAGLSPRYQVWYTDPKTRAPTLAFTPDGKALWQPNTNRMQDEDQDAELAKIEHSGPGVARTVSDWLASTPSAKGLGNIIRDNLR